MTATQGRKIAIVGASGMLGSHILDAILAKGIHTVTAISRPDSKATFPSGVTVERGDYADEDFLVSALKGNDVLILALAYYGSKQQIPLIKAAAEAGVPWVLPNEFGSDPNSPRIATDSPMIAEKKEYRDVVEQQGLSWIAVVCNPWLDWSMEGGAWGIKILDRTAELYDGGRHELITTTVPATAGGIAGLLSLPDAELARFKNKPAYLSSFHLTQREMFESVLRVTGTQEKDWKIQETGCEEAIARGKAQVAAGNYLGLVACHYVLHMTEGAGGDYSAKTEDMSKLGWEKEDLDEVMRGVVKALKENPELADKYSSK